MHMSTLRVALGLLGLMCSMVQATQPGCSRYNSQMATILEEVSDPFYFCHYYIAEPRTRSALPGFSAKSLVTSCRCLLKTQGASHPISPQKALPKPADPKSLICNINDVSNVQNAFKHPHEFCSFYNAKPRYLSMLPHVRPAGLMKACKCINNPGNYKTTGKQSTTSESVASSSSPSDTTADTTATAPTTETTTEPTTEPTTELTTGPTTDATADTNTVASTTSTPSTSDSSTTTTTSSTTTSTTTTSSTTTSTGPTCSVTPPSTFTATSVRNVANSITLASASFEAFFSGYGSGVTSVNQVTQTSLTSTLLLTDAVASCASVAVGLQNNTLQTDFNLRYEEVFGQNMWTCVVYTEDGQHDSAAYGAIAPGIGQVFCSYGYSEVEYADDRGGNSTFAL